jgi:hypothetical protein
MGELVEPQSRGGKRTTLAFLGIAVCVAGMVLLVKGLYPVNLPLTENPDFLDIVFDNRGVVWAARLLLVSAAAVLAFGGVFIIVSTGVRMKKGEWLRRAGPFEASETTVGEIEEQLDQWCSTALVRQEKVIELTECLDESDELIEGLHASLERSRYD